MRNRYVIPVFLLVVVSASVYAEEPPLKSLSDVSSVKQAKKHPIVSTKPAIDFFEGAILGNGGLGAVVTTRPDAVVIHFGHNDVWDIRLINECMLQSYNGELRFFPNWPKDKDVQFKSLRTVGAFLVSAKYSGGQVEWIEVLSEAGQPLNITSPWEAGTVCKSRRGEEVLTAKRFRIETQRGEFLQLKPR